MEQAKTCIGYMKPYLKKKVKIFCVINILEISTFGKLILLLLTVQMKAR